MNKKLAILLVFAMLLTTAACQSSQMNGTTPTDPSGTVATEDSMQETEQTDPTQSGETEPEETDPTEPEPAKDDIVRITEYIPTAREALAYATTDNFTGRQIYAFTDAYLRYGTLQKLMLAAAELEEMGYGIIIWDAYRPVYAQEKLWNIFSNPVYVSKPGTGSQSHSRGIAIDLTLYDLETGAVLEMPSKMDVFNDTSDRYYGDVSATAAANSQLLESVMVKYGFQGYVSEWWHYSDTESYPIEQQFDPADGVRPPDVYEDDIIDQSGCVRNSPEEYFSNLYGTLWYATCNKSMSLRAIASVNGRTLKVLRPNDPLVLLGCDGYFAKVSSEGTVGYVLWAYIKPADMNYFDQILNVVDYVNVYTYEMMTEDLAQLREKFPEAVTLDTIGNSEWGTPIPVVRVGNEEARYHVLIQASIHGCEHISTWLVMTMLDYWVGHAMSEYDDVCYHVIPMLNPDGVYTAQTKTLNDEQYQIYLNDQAKGYSNCSVATYAANWKANGKGVDLNRNFSSGWELITYRDSPSCRLYAGEEPFDAAETIALRDYTLLYDFDVTLSYHTAGSILYYEYGNDASVNAQSASLAVAVKNVTGYPLVDASGTDGAGYKDWVIDELKLPSLTVELGWAHPVDAGREQRPLFASNCHVMEAVADWLRDHIK